MTLIQESLSINNHNPIITDPLWARNFLHDTIDYTDLWISKNLETQIELFFQHTQEKALIALLLFFRNYVEKRRFLRMSKINSTKNSGI